jgi:hypothetical protein
MPQSIRSVGLVSQISSYPWKEHVDDKPVVQHKDSPVYVRPYYRTVGLAIGEPKPGKPRYAYLTPREAQRVALALLRFAEESLTKAEKSD